MNEIGCGGRIRTSNRRINNPLLYQLSYTTVFAESRVVILS